MRKISVEPIWQFLAKQLRDKARTLHMNEGLNLPEGDYADPASLQELMYRSDENSDTTRLSPYRNSETPQFTPDDYAIVEHLLRGRGGR